MRLIRRVGESAWENCFLRASFGLLFLKTALKKPPSSPYRCPRTSGGVPAHCFLLRLGDNGLSVDREGIATGALAENDGGEAGESTIGVKLNFLLLLDDRLFFFDDCIVLKLRSRMVDPLGGVTGCANTVSSCGTSSIGTSDSACSSKTEVLCVKLASFLCRSTPALKGSVLCDSGVSV